jgi:Golgi apparatus protein 1
LGRFRDHSVHLLVIHGFFCFADVLISRMATQQQLAAGEAWTQGIHQEKNTTLEYEYRMVCSAHYYGSDCDTLCRSRDDQFGHYTCGPNGEKICNDGYQKDPSNPEGDYCTKGIWTFLMVCT